MGWLHLGEWYAVRLYYFISFSHNNQFFHFGRNFQCQCFIIVSGTYLQDEGCCYFLAVTKWEWSGCSTAINVTRSNVMAKFVRLANCGHCRLTNSLRTFFNFCLGPIILNHSTLLLIMFLKQHNKLVIACPEYTLPLTKTQLGFPPVV